MRVVASLILLTITILCQAEEGELEERFYSGPGQRPRYPPRRPGYPGPPRPPRPNGDQPLVFEEPQYNRPATNGMDVLFSWKQVDFIFPDESTREFMLRHNHFIPRNNLILDVDVYGDGSGRTVFVTLPRVRPGVPVTLATVSSQRRNGAILLEPFPNWSSHSALAEGHCDQGITSVFRTHVDACGRLWVLDSGNNNAFAGNSSIVCQPKVLIYDLRQNNRLIGKFPIPMNMIESNTLLVTIVVDIRSSDCSDAFAYIADSIAYKMIAFNLRTQQYWRMNSILFFPYPDYSTFTVNGVSFDLMGGIFGLALGPLYRREKRVLYFHCIDSIKQSWADTSDLRDQSLWQSNMNAKPRAFHLFNGTRPSQSAAATMNEQGIMFFGLVGSNEIACWDSRKKFTRSNIVSLAKDDRTLQFNSGIKVYRNKLYVATSRLQNYITNQVKENEENYRILVGDVDQMTRNTKCEAYQPEPAQWIDPHDILIFPDDDEEYPKQRLDYWPNRDSYEDFEYQFWNLKHV